MVSGCCLWLGLILVVGGLVRRHRTAFATAVRRTLAGGLERSVAALADGPAPAGRWVAANAGWLRGAIGVLGVVVLLWGNDVSETRLFWSLVLVVVLLAARAGPGRRRAGVHASPAHDADRP